MTKRITALLLSVLLCLTLVGTAFAEGETSTITGEAGGKKISVALAGMPEGATYYMCSLMVKQSGGEFKIYDTFSFKVKEGGVFNHDFEETTYPELAGGDALRVQVPGYDFGGGKDYVEGVVSKAPVEVTEVKLDKAEATVEAGKTLQLTATVEPAGAEKKLTWTSSDETVATVDTNGLVTALAEGETIITAIASNGVKAQCKVTVTAAPVPETPAVTMAKTANITVGGSYTLTAAVTPAGSSYTAEWSVSDAKLATVTTVATAAGQPDNPRAKVELTSEAKAGEKFTVTVTVTVDGKTYSAACEFTVVRRTSGGGGGSGAIVSSGYTVTVGSASHGSVSTSPSRPSRGQTVTITVNPDKGYVLDKLTVKDADGETISTAKAGDNKYTFTMPDSKVTVDATFKAEEKAEEPAPSTPDVSFNDVPAGYWAYDQITWAAEKGIMNGYGNGVFGPERNTTRQALWMVLARLDGANPADMAAARTWAVSNGVSDGSNPTSTMSRQQMVTMLYRYAQMKGYSTGARADITGYTDAGSVASYAKDALGWAVGQGVMKGSSSEILNPTGTASRAHFAVFMNRFCTLYGIA